MHIPDHRAKTPEGWEYVAKSFVQGNDIHHPEINEFVLSKGDYLLLCSDGLYNCFTDEEIEHLLERITDIDELQAVFLKRGKDKARDNYSAIIIKITDI